MNTNASTFPCSVFLRAILGTRNLRMSPFVPASVPARYLDVQKAAWPLDFAEAKLWLSPTTMVAILGKMN